MRSVVLKTTPRCPRCQLPPRWCVCAGQRPIVAPLAIDIVMHHREQFRPSSTGNVIARVLPDARLHLWRHERRLTAEEVRRPNHETWVLHPHGEPVPAVAPDALQIVLLDGSWSEASAMAKESAPWGRRIALPMTGTSRYWLRDQQDGARFSTIEALLFLLQHFGWREARTALDVQFELHVYASLRARGQKETAARFLTTSPLVDAMPDLIAEMNVRRPR